MALKVYTRFLKNLLGNVSKGCTNYSTNSPCVIVEEIGDKVVIILNRPKVLNAINVKLNHELLDALKKSEKTKSLLLFKGAGGRAFSAGGDLMQLKDAAEVTDIVSVRDTILYLNCCIYQIYRYKIPTVVLMDGIAYGGGAGLSVFATHRIATERTRFAMPEAKIGFHPNSAGTYFLNRTKGKLGCYLALTAETLNGSDVLRAGFATHFCQSKNIKTLEEQLLKTSNEEDVKHVLDDICEKQVPEFSLNPVIDEIDRCFSEASVEGILKRLEEDGSSWAQHTYDTLCKYSPTSLKVILRQLQKGRGMDLADALVMESCLTANFYNFPDVFEGTRVVLKDRHDTPKWTPSRLEDVTEDIIEKHFEPTVKELQRKLLREHAF